MAIQASRWAKHLVMKCPVIPKEIKMELGKTCKQHHVCTRMKELSDAHKWQQDQWSPLPLSNDENDDHDEDDVIVLPSPAKKRLVTMQTLQFTPTWTIVFKLGLIKSVCSSWDS